MIKAIFFDVDGTLWDSTEIVARSWTDYLKTEGIFMEITSQRLMQLIFCSSLLPYLRFKTNIKR